MIKKNYTIKNVCKSIFFSKTVFIVKDLISTKKKSEQYFDKLHKITVLKFCKFAIA